MKIIIFSHLFPNKNFPYDGIFNLSRAKALDKQNCEVIVIAPISLNPYFRNIFPKFRLSENIRLFKKLNSIPPIEYIEGIKVYHPKWMQLPNKMFWKYHSEIMHFYIGRKVQEIMKAFKPDLIISTWLNPFATYSEYFKKELNVMTFALAEGSDLLIHPYQYAGWDKIQSKINTNCELILAVSNRMKKHMEQKTKFNNIEVIRNGYDEELFQLNDYTRITQHNPIRIVSVGSFHHVKGQDILIKAIMQLKIPFELTIVGSGPELEVCQSIVHNYKLDKVVHFIGNLQHNALPEELIRHDIFCLPSRSEGFPAAPLEAMGCGLPVVSSNVGDMDEIIIDGFNGLLFKCESPEDLADKLTLASKIDWKKNAISKWVENRYSWNNWATQILEKHCSYLKENKILASSSNN